MEENLSDIRNIPKSMLKDKSKCYLCGSGELMGYYKQFDSIGVINLNTGQICDIGLFSYDEGLGNLLKPDKHENHIITSTDEKARIISVSTDQERRISNVDLIFTDEGSPLHDEMVATLFCDECLAKFYKPDNFYVFYDYCYNIAFVDFTSGEPYPVNGFYRGYFIKDYYVHFEYLDDHISALIFYVPKYSNLSSSFDNK